MKSIFVIVLTLFLLQQRVSGLLCPLQATGTGQVELAALCAMCSDSNAAVRWTVREDKKYDILVMKYTCKDQNGSEIYTEDSPTASDTCFEEYPAWQTEKTGAHSIGYLLSTGVQCEFRMLYRVDQQTHVIRQNCTIKSPEACAANQDECQVDRISEMTEDGECQYHCAEGLAGELCNNVNECHEQGNTTCDENADCHDTDGSYWCQCRSGFTEDGYNCTDINECETQNYVCSDDNAHCVNSVGNFSCQCNPGFTGDGYNCSAIPVHSECVACDRDAECVYNEGRYQCKCTAGYDGDGHTCSAFICTQVGDTCHRENTVCKEDEVRPDIYRCSCLPGFRDVAGNCTDIDECGEGSFICHDNTTCTNLIGSYLCKSNVDASDDNTAVTVIGVTLGASFLSLLLVVGIVALFHYFKCKREKTLPFQDLTKMTLDPYYTPSFWNGSLSSVHSTYEKLTFSNSTTNVKCSEKCEYQTESHEDRVSISITEQVTDLTSSHTAESDEGELHILLTVDQLAVQRNKYVQEIPTHTHTCGHITDINAVYVPDTKASVGRNKTAQNTSTTCGNCILSEAAAPTNCSISLHIPGTEALPPPVAATTPNMSGYIQEHNSASCNIYHVTGSGTSKLKCTTGEASLEGGLSKLRASRDPENGPSTDYTTESTICSSGYVTESEGQGSCSSNTLTQDRRIETAFRKYSASSSGYASESVTGDPGSPSTGRGDMKFKPWHSQTSLQSDDSENTTDLGTEDFVDTVTFTVNRHQEFEYVNMLEETFYNDVNFDVVP